MLVVSVASSIPGLMPVNQRRIDPTVARRINGKRPREPANIDGSGKCGIVAI